ncbi:MAG: hypothetical protein EA375_00860 [Acholeplasmataceae bacterium]|nr:MAG: hypothetical protein EA375_00860 [Acholeplasmataceae bacterium]
MKKSWLSVCLRHITVLLMSFMGSLLLYGCSPLGPEDMETLAIRIQEDLPRVVNHDFTLPSYPGANITWSVQGNTYEDTFVYESPWTDLETQIDARIRIGGTTQTYTYPLTVLARDSAANQNRLDITMPVPLSQLTRETYVPISITVTTTRNGEAFLEHHASDAEIRGRGNSTWFMPKKPFRVRFSSNTSVLGMPAARNYVLLAEYADKSLLRNTIVHKFSSLLEHLDHHIQTRAVEVYVNGTNQGVYTLTEHVEIHRNKLFIESVPGELNTGYFFELDQRFWEQDIDEGFDWIVVRGIPYDIKRPNTSHDNYTAAQAEFLREIILAAEDALIAQSGYEDLIDVDNWIDYFIVHELFKNVDVGWSSVFAYREKDGKLKLGPLWDFDLAIGNANYIDWGVENWYGMREHKNRWFRLMMDVPEIRLRFRDRYLEIHALYLPEIIQAVPVLAHAMSDMAGRNFHRWQILNMWVWPNTPPMLEATTYMGQTEFVLDYIQYRAQWMAEAVNSSRFLNGQFD